MITLDRERCVGCGRCIGFCATDALANYWGYLEIEVEKCTDCFVCIDNCPVEALSPPLEATERP